MSADWEDRMKSFHIVQGGFNSELSKKILNRYSNLDKRGIKHIRTLVASLGIATMIITSVYVAREFLQERQVANNAITNVIAVDGKQDYTKLENSKDGNISIQSISPGSEQKTQDIENGTKDEHINPNPVSTTKEDNTPNMIVNEDRVTAQHIIDNLSLAMTKEQVVFVIGQAV